jgi:putative ABC transport system permease protein
MVRGHRHPGPVPLAPELDLGALIGWQSAQRYLGFDGDITTLYVRTDPDAVEAVRGLLARTANPARPNEVDVSRPSDALAAQAAAETTFTGLLLGLGAVALLVGGIGVANTMVISVLERRAEIGLRRSLGATRGHIRIQFLAESLLLSVLGGGAGVLLGSGVTAVYATLQNWPTVVPAWSSQEASQRPSSSEASPASIPPSEPPGSPPPKHWLPFSQPVMRR